MPQLRHIAISTQDPDAAAKFFTSVFDMTVVGTIDNDNASGCYVSDGHINFALLRYKTDGAAGGEYGKGYSGLHHLGFHVEDIEAAAKRFAAAGYEPRQDINDAQGLDGSAPKSGHAEYKYAGPDGVIVDISQGGWVGTPPLGSDTLPADAGRS